MKRLFLPVLVVILLSGAVFAQFSPDFRAFLNGTSDFEQETEQSPFVSSVCGAALHYSVPMDVHFESNVLQEPEKSPFLLDSMQKQLKTTMNCATNDLLRQIIVKTNTNADEVLEYRLDNRSTTGFLHENEITFDEEVCVEADFYQLLQKQRRIKAEAGIKTSVCAENSIENVPSACEITNFYVTELCGFLAGTEMAKIDEQGAKMLYDYFKTVSIDQKNLFLTQKSDEFAVCNWWGASNYASALKNRHQCAQNMQDWAKTTLITAIKSMLAFKEYEEYARWNVYREMQQAFGQELESWQEQIETFPPQFDYQFMMQ